MKWLAVICLAFPSLLSGQSPKPNVSAEFAAEARRAVLAYRDNSRERAAAAYQEARLAMDPKNPNEVLGLAQVLNYSMAHSTAKMKVESGLADADTSLKSEMKCFAALDEMFRKRIVKQAPECQAWKP